MPTSDSNGGEITVYVAMRGENYEGGHILGVYASYEDAEKRVLEERAKRYFVGCDWAKVVEETVIEGDVEPDPMTGVEEILNGEFATKDEVREVFLSE
ncbi:hypothetical protein AUR64_17315 [Haloprofundus marisrubri]|uniref:Uncharacterized protein n=1 Tax=Haloprofundus marisrubri TaxID=1514971 RepID=A0A0W1R7F9_9EURY|nr:hypothetical protein [Haloprofundus marisrubri]KTG09526.1 hypothetical protein AUR64_17315 [Haloprofundus marisrubri]